MPAPGQLHHTDTRTASVTPATVSGRVAERTDQVNGYPAALILRLSSKIDTVLAARIDDGLITGLYAMRNPEGLSRVERETAVSR
ncbi:hypothetical protein [Micromonospora sp. NPDC007230]|uniref:hypothetical protein n=1 Tax=Micromonospora sp. NPDC007230 TaxID=3364237 RepID=UPI0036AFDA73